MDRPVLHAFVRELLALERLQAFAAALPARARVSEPVLPLLLAALHERARARARRACCPRTRTRATPPRRRAGSSAPSASRCCRAAASAGAPGSSRRRTSSASARARSTCSRRGGLVCASATALAEGVPPAAARPEPVRLDVGAEPGLDGLAESARARRLRAGRAGRGARPVRRPRRPRRRLPDDGPRAAPRSSSSATRSSRCARSRPSRSARCTRSTAPSIYPAAERRADLTRADARRRRASRHARGPARSRAGARPARPTSSGSPTRCARVWAEEGLERDLAQGRVRARPVPAGAAVLVRGAAARDRRARARRGRERADGLRPRRQPRRRRVPARAARRCAPSNLLKRADSRLLEAGEDLPEQPELLFAVAPARRGFVWRELGLVLLPDTQVFRKRPPRADTRLGRALAVVRRPAHRRLRRPRGPRRREAARLRDEGGRGRHARLPLPRVPRRGPALRPARAARQGLALHRRRRRARPRSRSSAARRGRT